MVKQLNQNTFHEEIGNTKELLLVDFYADWCGPCKMLGPVVESLSEDSAFSGKVRFAKINVDENSELAFHYKVVSIPMLLLFKDGQVVDTIIGFAQQQEISEMLKRHL